MKVLKVDHIGIAVKNMDEALKLYRDVLGLKMVDTEVVEEQKVKVGFLPVGDSEIELSNQPRRTGRWQNLLKAVAKGYNT